ncbi:M23 family metallopeptidase [Sinomonas halotolerans]|uniref:M23 family metallopeptidase n=1 Tax=Sinomonas halotolerans TaxID=1644133 RepID=A0ABU9WZB6_9MICC
MDSARLRGRRRAEPARPFRLLPSAPARRAGSYALVAGFLALGAAPGLVGVAMPGTPGLEQAALQAQPEVAASQDAELDFPRTSVATAKKPKAAAVKAQGSVSSKAASAAAPTTPAGLGKPLASLQLASPFGWRANPLGTGSDLHTGADFVAACGTPVIASAAGTVVEAGWHAYGGGNRIVVNHGNGLKTTYNHLSTIGVSVGQKVGAAQQIGAAGTTGASTGCHLHFEVVEKGTTVDPMGFL